MLLNESGDLVGFDLCALFCHKAFICSQNTQNSEDSHTHGYVILNFR